MEVIQFGAGTICTFGEIIQDVIVTPQSELSYGGGHIDGEIAYFRGGCGPNVAAGCAQMGVNAKLIGHYGADAVGDLLAKQLRHAGVHVARIRRGRTANSVSIATPGGDTALVFSPGDSRSMSPEDIKVSHLHDVAIVHLNSHHLYSAETRAAFLHLVELARNVGALVSLDVSAANRLQTYGVDRYRQVVSKIKPDILMANSSESSALGIFDKYPTGAALVLAHQGSRPTICLNEQGVELEVPVRPVDGVVDTTGAGDAFAAGYLSSRLQGHDLKRSVEDAHSLAARTIVRMGSEYDVERAVQLLQSS